MKIENPFHVDPARAARADALKTYLQGRTSKASATFDEVRAAVPAFAGAADGEVHQAALDIGAGVARE